MLRIVSHLADSWLISDGRMHVFLTDTKVTIDGYPKEIRAEAKDGFYRWCDQLDQWNPDHSHFSQAESWGSGSR